MTRFIILFFLSFFFVKPLIADEGMWLPQLLSLMNEEDMHKKGLKITAEDIYDINNSSLKDAVVALNGGGCTAEMISSEGLMLTNHHCVDDLLQAHSSVEKNYLEENSQIKKKLFSDWKKDKKNIKILNTTNSGHYIHFGEPEWVITELEAYLKSLK